MLTFTSLLAAGFLDPRHLIDSMSPYGELAVILIIFAETGLLIGFFLPGDSLLFTAGLLASQGRGQAPDPAQARLYLGNAAALGHARAQFNLACLLFETQGGAPDPQQALSLLQQAAQQDDAAALYTLGRLHVVGEWVAQDEVQALAYYARAAALGDPAARFNLGYMHAHAQGTVQNYAVALQWYRAAAGQEPSSLGLAPPRAAGLRSSNPNPNSNQDLRQAA